MAQTMPGCQPAEIALLPPGIACASRPDQNRSKLAPVTAKKPGFIPLPTALRLQRLAAHYGQATTTSEDKQDTWQSMTKTSRRTIWGNLLLYNTTSTPAEAQHQLDGVESILDRRMSTSATFTPSPPTWPIKLDHVYAGHGRTHHGL